MTKLYTTVLLCFLTFFVESQSEKSKTYRLGPTSRIIDLTLIPGAIGEDVVNACILKIESLGVFMNDFGLLRRIARVETDFGTSYAPDANTNRGIWQIPTMVETSLQDVTNQARLTPQIDSIRSTFGGDFLNFNNMDLTIPFQSVVALRLYLDLLGINNLPGSVSDQASWWTVNYNTNGTTTTFEITITTYEETLTCSEAKLDLWFCLDRSGSIDPADFATSLEFVREVASQFNISSDVVRTGISLYNSNVFDISFLDEHQSNTAFDAAINAIPVVTGGGTSTGLAITDAVNDGFSETNGARPAAEAVPRVLVVVTDGQSGDSVVAPSNNAHAAGITVFAVGVGSGFNPAEINQIASDPDTQYASSLADFDALLEILTQQIAVESCTASALVPVNVNITVSIARGNDHFSTIDAPTTGILFLIFNISSTNSAGQVYFGTIPQPSQALHFLTVTLLPSSTFQLSVDLALAFRSRDSSESDSDFKKNFGARQQTTNPLYIRIVSAGTEELVVTYSAVSGFNSGSGTVPSVTQAPVPPSVIFYNISEIIYVYPPPVTVISNSPAVTVITSDVIIIISVVGGVLVFVLIIFIAFLCRRKRKNQKISSISQTDGPSLENADNVIHEPAYNLGDRDQVTKDLQSITSTLNSGSAFGTSYLLAMQEVVARAQHLDLPYDILQKARKELEQLEDRLEKVKYLKDDLRAKLTADNIKEVKPMLAYAQSLDYIDAWSEDDEELRSLLNQAHSAVLRIPDESDKDDEVDGNMSAKPEEARQKLRLAMEDPVESAELKQSMTEFKAILANSDTRNDADKALLEKGQEELDKRTEDERKTKQKLQIHLQRACKVKDVKRLEKVLHKIAKAQKDSSFVEYIADDQTFKDEIVQGKALLVNLKELSERRLAVMSSQPQLFVSNPPEYNKVVDGEIAEDQLKEEAMQNQNADAQNPKSSEEFQSFQKLDEDPQAGDPAILLDDIAKSDFALGDPDLSSSSVSSAMKKRSNRFEALENRRALRQRKIEMDKLFGSDNEGFELQEVKLAKEAW